MNANNLRRILNFYRLCAIEDTRELDIDQIGLAKANTLPSNQFLSGKDPLIWGPQPEPHVDCTTIQYPKRLFRTYSNFSHISKPRLLYGIFYIFGVPETPEALKAYTAYYNNNADSQRKYYAKIARLKIATPVLYYEACLEEIQKSAPVNKYSEEKRLLTVNWHSPKLNTHALRKILKSNDARLLESAPLPSPFITPEYIQSLFSWLEEHCVINDTSSIHRFPHLDTNTLLTKEKRFETMHPVPLGLRLYCSAAIIRTPRNTHNDGLTHEMEFLEDSAGYSEPLQALMTGNNAIRSLKQEPTALLLKRLTKLKQTAPNSLDAWPLAMQIATQHYRNTTGGSGWLHYVASVLLKDEHLLKTHEHEIKQSISKSENAQLYYKLYCGLAPSTPHYLPAHLSAAQKKALRNVQKYPLSIVLGAPGTGKSYTLAALALDRYINNESVLIVTQNEQAAKVITDKLREEMHVDNDLVLNLIQNKPLMTAFKEQLEHISNPDLCRLAYDAEIIKQYHQEINESLKMEAFWMQQYASTYQENLRLSQQLTQVPLKFYPWWRRLLKHLFLKRQIRATLPINGTLERLGKIRKTRIANNISLLSLLHNQRIASSKSNYRNDMPASIYTKDVILQGHTTHLSPQDTHIDFYSLLKAVPIWIITSGDLHKVLPLYSELFDVLLVDEAAQTNISEMLPALQRCKRAVIAGDSQQLRHMTFLPAKREQQLYQATQLSKNEFDHWSYRKNSLLDLVQRQVVDSEAITFLDEHFRSHPELIRFSNNHFYGGQLKLVKARPSPVESQVNFPMMPHAQQSALLLERIHGTRKSDNTNTAEADRAIEHVQEHIERYKNKKSLPSIGVLSPFRAQADMIQTRICKHINQQDIVDFHITVGTPYNFQGNECHTMILSFVVDSNVASGYLSRANVFNVAITRAQERQIVLFSGDERALAANNLLRLYIEDTEQAHAFDSNLQSPQEITMFQQKVIWALQEHGVHQIWSNYTIAGHNISLIAYKNGRMTGIDLIGDRQTSRQPLPISYYQLVTRTNFKIIPISYAEWFMDSEKATQLIMNSLPSI